MGAVAPILVLMALAVLAALLFPIVAGASRDRRVTRGPSEIDTLLRRKATLYANMKDLEFEYKMGKLSEADYTRLYEEDRAEASRILREIDALEDRDDPDAIIEREIAARRAGTSTGLAGASRVPAREASSAAGPRAAGEESARCRACGAASRAADRFCSQCGAPLTSEAAQ